MKYLNNPNLFSEISAWNMVPSLKSGGLFGQGRYIDVDTGKISKFPAIDPEPYWVYTNPQPDVPCLELKAISDGFGFIAKACRDCWKIVVVPRSFHELIQLYELQLQMVEENSQCYCKCGVEPRVFIPWHYGGYFYARNKPDADKLFERVKNRVSESLSPDVVVYIKRGCTEFELKYGPSNTYKRPEGSDEIEKYFWENVNAEKGATKQPDFIVKNIIQGWMTFAWGRGDMTVKLYNNGKPLFPPCTTYKAWEGA
jgi:hypothetical protein